MTIAVFGNTYKDQTFAQVEHLLSFFASRQVRVLLSKELRYEMHLMQDYDSYLEDSSEDVDYAISVGGDGTFLGINCGHLGFLTAISSCEIDQVLERLLSGDCIIDERAVLQVSTQNGGHVMMPYALNEVAVMKQELSSMIMIDTYLDGHMLHTYKADGLVVATPTGSTAYSLSAGGTLVAPHVPALVLTPVATHSLNVRPLVITEDRVIELQVHSRSGSFLISVDGRSQAIREDVKLEIRKASHTIKIVQMKEHSFVYELKNKLLWGAEERLY